MGDLVCNFNNYCKKGCAHENSCTGELEKTLFEQMCMTQWLKGLISLWEAMGYHLKPFVDQLEGFLNPTIKGTVFENLTSEGMQRNIFEGEECWLAKDVLDCLKEFLVHTGNLQGTRQGSGSGNVQRTATYAKARQYNKFTHCGAIFSPLLFSVRDSYVVIAKTTPLDWYTRTIKQIFPYPEGQSSDVYFVIQKFGELSNEEALQDPYRQYPLVGGCLYYPELNDEIEVVPSHKITAYFVHTLYDRKEFGFPCFHALPLDKVGTLSPYCRLPAIIHFRIEFEYWMGGRCQYTKNEKGACEWVVEALIEIVEHQWCTIMARY